VRPIIVPGHHERRYQRDAKTGDSRITIEHPVVDPQHRSRAHHRTPPETASRFRGASRGSPGGVERLMRARLSVSGKIRQGRCETRPPGASRCAMRRPSPTAPWRMTASNPSETISRARIATRRSMIRGSQEQGPADLIMNEGPTSKFVRARSERCLSTMLNPAAPRLGRWSTSQSIWGRVRRTSA
jgi:hypothetical protein